MVILTQTRFIYPIYMVDTLINILFETKNNLDYFIQIIQNSANVDTERKEPTSVKCNEWLTMHSSTEKNSQIWRRESQR